MATETLGPSVEGPKYPLGMVVRVSGQLIDIQKPVADIGVAYQKNFAIALGGRVVDDQGNEIIIGGTATKGLAQFSQISSNLQSEQSRLQVTHQETGGYIPKRKGIREQTSDAVESAQRELKKLTEEQKGPRVSAHAAIREKEAEIGKFVGQLSPNKSIAQAMLNRYDHMVNVEKYLDTHQQSVNFDDIKDDLQSMGIHLALIPDINRRDLGLALMGTLSDPLYQQYRTLRLGSDTGENRKRGLDELRAELGKLMEEQARTKQPLEERLSDEQRLTDEWKERDRKIRSSDSERKYIEAQQAEFKRAVEFVRTQYPLAAEEVERAKHMEEELANLRQRKESLVQAYKQADSASSLVGDERSRLSGLTYKAADVLAAERQRLEMRDLDTAIRSKEEFRVSILDPKRRLTGAPKGLKEALEFVGRDDFDISSLSDITPVQELAAALLGKGPLTVFEGQPEIVAPIVKPESQKPVAQAARPADQAVTAAQADAEQVVAAAAADMVEKPDETEVAKTEVPVEQRPIFELVTLKPNDEAQEFINQIAQNDAYEGSVVNYFRTEGVSADEINRRAAIILKEALRQAAEIARQNLAQDQLEQPLPIDPTDEERLKSMFTIIRYNKDNPNAYATATSFADLINIAKEAKLYQQSNK